MNNMEFFLQPKCPHCGYPIYGRPAISRKDNKTEICSNCGIAEALSSFNHYLHTKKNAH